ncbi:MAG: phosphotriesterase [Bacteroidia bacterium]
MKTAVCCVSVAILFAACQLPEPHSYIMTVNGPLSVEEMGKSLIHEHVFLDWTGADSINPAAWDSDAAFAAILPYLTQASEKGVLTMLECTPAYLGRNPALLKKLSDSSGIHILTNTGYYGARKNKYIPAPAFSLSVDNLAAIWVDEWENGISGTSVKPGFIKIGVDSDSVLSGMHEKIVKAAARAHLHTGLTIVGHTGPDAPAFAQIALLREEGVDPSAFVWTHAQQGTMASHVKAASMGAWVSLDGMGWMAPDSVNDPQALTVARYVEMITNMRENHQLRRLLISHDAGWYTFGEPEGGKYQPYTAIFDQVIPALKVAGFSEDELTQLLVNNPAEAYQIRVRRVD